MILESHARLQERSLSLDDAQAMRNLYRKQKELEAILEDETGIRTRKSRSPPRPRSKSSTSNNTTPAAQGMPPSEPCGLFAWPSPACTTISHPPLTSTATPTPPCVTSQPTFTSTLLHLPADTPLAPVPGPGDHSRAASLTSPRQVSLGPHPLQAASPGYCPLRTDNAGTQQTFPAQPQLAPIPQFRRQSRCYTSTSEVA